MTSEKIFKKKLHIGDREKRGSRGIAATSVEASVASPVTLASPAASALLATPASITRATASPYVG
jgi:hypothetical protein